MSGPAVIRNGGKLPLSQIPVLTVSDFRRDILDSVSKGARISALFGSPTGENIRLIAVLAWRDTGSISVLSAPVQKSYPALTPDCPQAHLFEREIFEQWHVMPEGHPWLKPVRFPDSEKTSGIGVTNFFQIEGEEIHEVAVGPVHAGIIEPGHFRFQCHGETVHHLEISLGYQHRGVERSLVNGPNSKSLHFIETLAGDTTVGHATAFSRIVESLAGIRAPARAQVIRGIALELERMANHIGDLGALAGDIGYLPTMSYCGRIRGDLLNLTAMLCGNRFGRRLVVPGGVGYDIDSENADKIAARLKSAFRDAESAIGLLWETPSVLARFENTGALSRETAVKIGLVGVAARACGLQRDVRSDFPYGIFLLSHIPAATWESGDVFARAFVRWQELQRSYKFILEQLAALPDGAVRAGENPPIASGHLAVALVEGWRGEICHVAITNNEGRFLTCKVVDPSFHNWFGLALALRGQQISDFPLCNKSFNLSYCGHDL
ncbi:MAG TPA: hydrogenase [Kiritimatiellia bacterium]|nr:hydrogenase [Kiritimatiellia bacterium]